jgi:F-type H+-transporting ATPase subunit epsilon
VKLALRVQFVSPERVLLTCEAEYVIARTVGGGDIEFLPGHVPFLGLLATWPLKIKQVDGTETVAAVHGGFIEVYDDQVIVLSDDAELAEEIDTERALRAKERAEARLLEMHDAEAEAALRRAHARLRAAGLMG